MKKLTSLFALMMLLGTQCFSQTFGIFAEREEAKVAGDLFTDSRTPTGGWVTRNGATAVLVGEDLAYYGDSALQVEMFGLDSKEYLTFTVDTDDPEGSVTRADFSEFNEPDTWLVMFIKLKAEMSPNVEIQSLRDGAAVSESDEPLSKFGLNTKAVDVWQKVMIPIVSSTFEGHNHTYEQFAQFSLRSRGAVGVFILDEVFVDYRPKTTFGIYADNPDFKVAGSLATDSRTPNGGWFANGVEASEVVDAEQAFAGDNCLNVAMDGFVSKSWLHFVYDKDDPFGMFGSGNFSEWNDINATLVLHVQLLMDCDFHITYQGLRNGVVMEESDEPMTSHGMDRTKIGEWQKITMILDEGLEGNTFDFSQWAGFNLRDRNNVANFLVDEVYVIYPEGSSNVGIAPMKQSGSNMHLRNYPNPASDITTIEFTLTQAAPTSLVVYDMLGQKAASLINKTLSAGDHKISFNVKDYTPGIYLYELRSGNQSQVKKMFINTMF